MFPDILITGLGDGGYLLEFKGLYLKCSKYLEAGRIGKRIEVLRHLD